MNNLHRYLVRGALLSGLILVFAGCGNSEKLKTVTGTVSYKGNSLDSGLVSFFPGGGRPIGSPIKADGTYRVELPPGDYTVTISSSQKVPADFQEGDPQPPPDPNALPARFAQPNRSGLTATISQEGSVQEHNIELP